MTAELPLSMILDPDRSEDLSAMYPLTLELALWKIPDFSSLVQLEVKISDLPYCTRRNLENLFPESTSRKGGCKELQVQLSKAEINGLDSITADLRVGKDVAIIQFNESGLVRLLPFDMIPSEKRYYGLLIEMLGIKTTFAELERLTFADYFLDILQNVLVSHHP